MPDAASYRFGNFELDPSRRLLLYGAETVPIQPRVFDLLCFLAARPEQAIRREELLERVWSDLFVTDGSLSKAIRVLRSTLGRDPALVDVVETVRGYGYRFSPPAAGPPDANAPSPIPVETDRPVVSREIAFDKFERALDAVRSGARHTLWVEGEPGTGKTTLVRAALDQADAQFAVGIGQCLDGFGERSPYLPVLEALVHLCLSGDDRRGQRFRELIARAAPNWLGHLPALFPDHEATIEPIQPRRAQMARELVDAFELIAREAPVVLLIEDLQWADASSIQLLASLSKRGLPLSLAIVLTARRAEIAARPTLRGMRADLVRQAGVTVIEMTPISPAGIRAHTAWSLRQTGAGTDVPIDQLVDWLRDRTAGHPLFLVQLTDHLASLELLANWNEEGDSLRQLEGAGLPETLGQLLAHWVGTLDPTDRQCLEAASVAGFYFDTRSLEAALGLEAGEAEESCDRLCAEGWLQFRDFLLWPDGSRGMRLSFGHALYAEALYSNIPPARRRRLHHAIAQRIDAGHEGRPDVSNELGDHYERASVLDQAARHRSRAAVFAASRQSVAEAIDHAESAFPLLGHLPKGEALECETDLNLSVGAALALREGFGSERANESFERARVLAEAGGDGSREAAAMWGLASSRSMRGEIEAARGAGERLLHLAAENDDSRFQLLALDVLCNIAYFQGRFRDCIAQRDATLTLSEGRVRSSLPVRSLEDVQANSHAYAALAHWHLGEVEAAITSIEESLKLAHKIERPQTEAVAHAFASILANLLDDPERQRRRASQARQICEAGEIGLWLEISQFMEICSEPPSHAALPQLEKTLGDMSRYGGLGGTYFVGLLAGWEATLGNHAKARALCDFGIDTAKRTSELNNLPVLYLTRASIAETSRERADLLAAARESAHRIGSLALQREVHAAYAE